MRHFDRAMVLHYVKCTDVVVSGEFEPIVKLAVVCGWRSTDFKADSHQEMMFLFKKITSVMLWVSGWVRVPHITRVMFYGLQERVRRCSARGNWNH